MILFAQKAILQSTIWEKKKMQNDQQNQKYNNRQKRNETKN